MGSLSFPLLSPSLYFPLPISPPFSLSPSSCPSVSPTSYSFPSVSPSLLSLSSRHSSSSVLSHTNIFFFHQFMQFPVSLYLFFVLFFTFRYFHKTFSALIMINLITITIIIITLIIMGTNLFLLSFQSLFFIFFLFSHLQ